MSEPSKKNDWNAYEEGRIRNNSFYSEDSQTYDNRAYEYGQFALKNVMLISGGALIAIPAIAGMSNTLTPDEAADAAFYFVGSLLLSILVAYAVHLNWAFLRDLTNLQQERGHARIARAHIPDFCEDFESDEFLKKKIATAGKRVDFTFWAPHVLGILAFALFFCDCWHLYDGIITTLGAET